jgi:hypothetical protein
MRRLLIALALAGVASYVVADVFPVESVKAAFLYRFASYVEWPPEVPQAPFVIGVAGSEEVATQLEALLPRMAVRGHAAQLRRVSRVSDLDGVHILYIGPGVLPRSRSLLAEAVKRPVLLVTDDEDGLGAGAVINFRDSDRNVRFEVSLAASDRARLKVDAALLSVAARVERRPHPVGENK